MESNNDFKEAIFNNSERVDNYDDAILQWEFTEERDIAKGDKSKCICGEILRRKEFIIYNELSRTELILGPSCIKNITECKRLYKQALDKRREKRILNSARCQAIQRTIRLCDARINEKNKKNI